MKPSSHNTEKLHEDTYTSIKIQSVEFTLNSASNLNSINREHDVFSIAWDHHIMPNVVIQKTTNWKAGHYACTWSQKEKAWLVTGKHYTQSETDSSHHQGQLKNCLLIRVSTMAAWITSIHSLKKKIKVKIHYILIFVFQVVTVSIQTFIPSFYKFKHSFTVVFL
jgi:hypothetical protein